MLFNSIAFLVFFPLVTLLYFLLPHKMRWLLLLLASCYFYMAFIPAYILILFATIGVDYFAGIYMEKLEGRKKKACLIASITVTLAILFVFKYFNFFNANLAAVAQYFHWNYSLESLAIILPIGLSFHTFQSMSYVIEVYRGRQKAERNFGIYALYVMFYPQLVAGPIERPQNLLHQFYEKHVFEYRRVTDGLKLMAWGMFKKVVVADRLAEVVNQIYGHPHDYTGIPLAVATVLFAFQIYCDFSGYSDIAIGSAKVMGFRLMNNFERPYFSKSIHEFWKRWHISLSTWFKDYVYIPLGGNQVSRLRWYANLFVTFLISGLWHGANWTFIVWGGLNGAYLVISHWTQPLRRLVAAWSGLDRAPRVHKTVKAGMTFGLVCLAWVFFRADTLADALYIISAMVTGTVQTGFHLFQGDYSTAFRLAKGAGYAIERLEQVIALLAIATVLTVHWLQRKNNFWEVLTRQAGWLRWSFYYALIFGTILFGAFGKNQFIYFQF